MFIDVYECVCVSVHIESNRDAQMYIWVCSAHSCFGCSVHSNAA